MLLNVPIGISLGMRNRHPSRFDRMLELDMTSLLGDLNPAIRLEGRDDLLRIDAHLYTLFAALSSV
jgi:hypothetical protein